MLCEGMVLAFHNIPFIKNVLGQGPGSFTADPATELYGYFAYWDQGNHPVFTISTINRLNTSTQTVDLQVDIPGTDAEGSIAIPVNTDDLIFWSAVTGGGTVRFWRLDRKSFAIRQISPAFGAAPFFAINFYQPLVVSPDGQWAVGQYFVDNILGSYVGIWHIPTNTVFEGYLSGTIPLIPNRIFSMSFDPANNLYLACGFSGLISRCVLAESVPGTITLTRTGTLQLPETSLDIQDMVYHPQTQQMILFFSEPHQILTVPLKLRYINIPAFTLGQNKFTIDLNTLNVQAGLQFANAATSTKFPGTYQRKAVATGFFGIVDALAGSARTYDETLWGTTFGNTPPLATSLLTPSVSAIFTTNIIVPDLDRLRVYFLPGTDEPPFKIIVGLPIPHYLYGSDLGPRK